MSSFESIQDVAFALKAEGQEIKIKLKKGVPATGQATVEWNIPKPAQGCESSDTGAYAGILILISPEPMTGANIPQDGTVYVADPTADYDLSTADKIGNAYVVGAFYECEEKARGEDLTTSVVINDIISGQAYYVAGYALDCQNRYHSDGIRTYSDRFGSKAGGDFAARQTVELGEEGAGVLPTDGTGLIPGVNYEFDLIYDNTFPSGTDFKTIPVNIDGINGGTYENLKTEIEDAIALANNPTQSPIAPGAGSFYWNAVEEQLYQFDGQSYAAIDSINEPTDPSVITSGTYWFETTTGILYRFNIPSPTGWNIIPLTTSESDPENPDCDSYWFDGVIGRQWNGSTWCEKPTSISITDPSDCPTLACGTYWFDEANSVLSVWNEEGMAWDETAAIYWDEEPNNISNGTYWFDDAVEKLFIRNANMWVDITVSTKMQVEEPSPKVDGMLWYNPETEELKRYVFAISDWVDEKVLVWSEDPTNVESCDLWWNSVSDKLFTWDSVNSEWDEVATFIQSPIDPSEAAMIGVGDLWYNPTISKLFKWDGGDWVEVDHVEKATDPREITLGDSWYIPSTNQWFVWDTPNAGWNEINPIDSEFDPTSIPSGTYWYDTANNALFVRNGVAWETVLFSTQPFVPMRGEQWYDSLNRVLYEWSGTMWEVAVPVVLVGFNPRGGLTFVSSEAGSNTAVIIPAPEGNVSNRTPCSIGTGFAFSGVDDIGSAQCQYQNDSNIGRIYPARDIPDNSYLWSNLTIPGGVLIPVGGNDGQSGVPSYLEVGVGTDGSPDERRELMDSIRRQLGHPIVSVELDNVQLDTCVNIALETFRQRAAAATRRGFFFLAIEPGKQQYHMTNKVIGYNRIVTIMSAYRFTSAFLSSAHGAGAYGQIVLQHLYNMGTYDLTSFHLVSQYVEQLEMLFATRLTFGFHEHNRMLSFYSAFTRTEKVLLDCMVERTEQDLLKDRFTKIWIERYALAEAMMMLSHIRGKFASLPGAGGGVSLNAAELVTLAQSYREDCLLQLDEFVADTPEDVGMQSSFILG